MTQETQTPPASTELDDAALDLVVGGIDPPDPDRRPPPPSKGGG